jgi:Flp pilus assembly secretin CpaC
VKIIKALIICFGLFFCLPYHIISTSAQNSALINNSSVEAYKGVSVSYTIYEFNDSITAKLYFLKELNNFEKSYGKFEKNYDKIKIPVTAVKAVNAFETISIDLQRSDTSYVVRLSAVTVKILFKENFAI